jgi:hypothetical protein
MDERGYATVLGANPITEVKTQTVGSCQPLKGCKAMSSFVVHVTVDLI